MDFSNFSSRSHTCRSIDEPRLLLLQEVTEQIKHIDGNILEIGCHKCGCIAYLSTVFPERELIGFDRFEDGFTEISPEDKTDFFFEGMLDTCMQHTIDYLNNLNIKNIRLVKGDVRKTLFDEPPYPIALAIIDVDLYSPTLSAINWAWERLVVGGFLLVDDIGFPGVDKALEESGLVYINDRFWGVIKKHFPINLPVIQNLDSGEQS